MREGYDGVVKEGVSKLSEVYVRIGRMVIVLTGIVGWVRTAVVLWTSVMVWIALVEGAASMEVPSSGVGGAFASPGLNFGSKVMG